MPIVKTGSGLIHHGCLEKHFKDILTVYFVARNEMNGAPGKAVLVLRGSELQLLVNVRTTEALQTGTRSYRVHDGVYLRSLYEGKMQVFIWFTLKFVFQAHFPGSVYHAPFSLFTK
ncbi:hypothetical protein MMC72_005028 [Salmonella enterica]|nr:hypothetical protein [Salmonella enterica]